ncbi:Scr1 family TA system antitoxin-like transcriptional regulator [Streptomyces olivaceus]|uniref:Scr1 family TA system antitoxin-like transcriptional regulator n=1 Tax=Streptomyces olivaceus TaxID=47716 RepID=UPI001CCBECAE|nr:Scr1 family TA system antitoxin-like transcriptional regulator [Streptomyces olivaceus]MBZ6228946.1 helix-turn-helix domain-containing protein [Streptomyces olivaceus]
MTHINVLDPGAPPLDYYGFELRRHREAAGLTQRQLGDIVNYTGSLVGQIETARKLPTPEFSERIDAALGTGGLLSRLVHLVMRSQLPAWFQQVAELEVRAGEICTFPTRMIHGLLQTESYVRAVLSALDPAIVYTEGYDAGHPTANPETVRDCSLRYDHLRAAALSLRDSAALIRRVMEERYGEQRDTDDDPVA